MCVGEREKQMMEQIYSKSRDLFDLEGDIQWDTLGVICPNTLHNVASYLICVITYALIMGQGHLLE